MRRIQLIIAALSLVLLSGCLAVAAAAVGGAGYYQYDKNEVHQDYQSGLDKTWDATIASMRKLGYNVSADFPHGSTEGVIDLDSDKTWVKVEHHAQGFTRVRVRIGTFSTEDHQRRSRLLLEAIGKRLD